MRFIFLISFLQLFLFSCSEKEEPEPVYDWDYIEINTNVENFYIYNRGENEIIFYEFDCENYVENTIKKVKIPRAEVDSLYNISYRLITNPTYNETFCTDYVGFLYVGIQNHNSRYSIRLKSVCDWKEYNEETEKLNEILKKYIAESR